MGTEGLTAPYRIGGGSYISDALDRATLRGFWSLRERDGDTFWSHDGSANLSRPDVAEAAGDPPVPNHPGYRGRRFTDESRAATTAVSGLKAGDTFTFECWIRMRSFAADGILMTTTGSADTGPQISVMDDGDVRLYKRSVGEAFLTTGQPLYDASWHHLFVSHDVGSSLVCVDGVSADGTATNRVFTDDWTTFQLGAAASGVNADIAMAAWYVGALGTAVAMAHYRQGLTVVPSDMTYELDDTEHRHKVYVKGATWQGSGWVDPVGGIDWDIGFASDYLEVEHSRTRARRNRRGRAYLRSHRRIRSGEFTVEGWKGWRPGQLIYITDPAFGLDADTFEVKEVSGELAAGAPVTYTIRYGAPRKSLLRTMRRRDR
jgi:hypothetical protein